MMIFILRLRSTITHSIIQMDSRSIKLLKIVISAEQLSKLETEEKIRFGILI